MADDTRSPREIERELEQERAELRSTIDEIFERLTFEDAWERTGRYLRDNRSEYGHTLGRMVREKPVALALTAIGIGWLLFGPASPAPRRSKFEGAHPRRVPEADRDPYDEPAERLPRASEVKQAQRATPPAGAGSVHRDSSGTGAAAAHSAAPQSSDSLGSAKSTTDGSGGISTSTPRPTVPAATPTSRTGPTLTEGEAGRDRPSGTPPTGSATTSSSRGAGPAPSNYARDPTAPSSTPTSSAAGARPPSGTETSNREKDGDRKPST